MIAPRTDRDRAADELVARVEEFFKPGGLMEKAAGRAGFPYEPRPQQRQMARAVAEAIAGNRHLAVEAGTGVGKSFAYLVPAILAAKLFKAPSIVSTYTISLQEQILRKDLPFLKEALGEDFKAALVKGRSNYLCLRRLARAERFSADLFGAAYKEELKRLREWSTRTTDGSLQELTEQPPAELWNAVNVEHGNCMGHKCPDYAPCFLFRARREIASADLLVVNHHLFFSDLALAEKKGGILPKPRMVVLDEAHMIEETAADHLGLRLSQFQFEHWLRRLYSPDKGKGLLAALRKGHEAKLVERLHRDVARFFDAVREVTGLTARQAVREIRAPPVIPVDLLGPIESLLSALRSLHDEQTDFDVRAELSAVRRRGAELAEALELFLEQALPDCVYWVALEGARRAQIVLYSAPVEVGPLLRDLLFGRHSSVVMTSATLAVHGRLDYFAGRVGAENCDFEQVGSPFDYARQMRVVIARGMPDPNDTDAYIEAAARAVRHFVHLTRGRAFVLFTAERTMRAVAERVRDEFEAAGYDLFVQGEGLPRTHMIERFRASRAGVLFGLDSFWMGVDVRGEALSNVIITKLPFAVPDEPLIRARMERIEERGGDPFRDYSLPEAILKFRQGVGRLIRSQTDEGIVVILDPRVSTRWYGRWFLESIPECPVEFVDF